MWNALWYLQSSGGNSATVLIAGVELVEPIEVEVAQTILEVEVVPTIEVVLEEPITVEVD